MLAAGGALLFRPPSGSQASGPAAPRPTAPTLTGSAPAQEARMRRVEVLRTFPHERDAYTQGLLWSEGELFESTGRRGESTLRRLDPETGEVRQRIDLPEQYFGEGLALVDDRFIMLTWRAERAFVFDRESLAELEIHRYRGEGWGLCLDDDRLVMSDGTDLLTLTIPFPIYGVLRYLLIMREHPLAGPSDLLLKDHGLAWCAVGWSVAVALIIYRPLG